MSEMSNTSEYQKFTTLANFDKYPNLLVWLEKLADGLSISSACLMKIELVAEELFANVASYSYPNSSGNIEVWLKKTPNLIDMKFIDSGVEYNPLAKNDPDINLKAEERPIGGLGIYMIKQTVNHIDYEYTNNQNVLTVQFQC